MDLLTLLLGAAIGLVMGVTGAGGGVLALPALLYGLHLSMQQAAPIALVAVAVAATVGTIEGLRRDVVRYRAAVVIALAGWPFAAGGIALAHRMPDLALRLLFICALCVVAWRQRRRPEPDAAAVASVAQLDPATGRFVWTRRAWAGFAAIGATTGFTSGLLGVGGGFVLVPLLSRLTALDAASLVGTSLMVTALVTGFGAAAAVAQGMPIPWPFTLWFTLALALGMLAGRLVGRRLPEHMLRLAFAWLVAGVALAMVLDVARRWFAV